MMICQPRRRRTPRRLMCCTSSARLSFYTCLIAFGTRPVWRPYCKVFCRSATTFWQEPTAKRYLRGDGSVCVGLLSRVLPYAARNELVITNEDGLLATCICMRE